MLLKNRLDKLEAEGSPATVADPATPPTRALEIMLDALEKRYLRPPPEHPDMPQVIAHELLNRSDVSSEAIKMAQYYLAGDHEH